jgi:holin-like protein
MVTIHAFVGPKPVRAALSSALSLERRGEVSRALEHMAHAARLAGQAALLSVIYFASSAVVDILQVPIPGNLLALLGLLVLLMTGLLRLAHVEELATFLLRHLTFFFVPFTVGLLAQGPLLASAGVALLVSLVVAAAVGIVVAGLAAQAASRWSGAPDVDA